MRIAIAVVVAAATTTAWTLLGPQLVPKLQDWMRAFGPLLPVGFVTVVALAIALCAPASLLYVTGGMIFGLPKGLMLCSAGAILGSSIAFVLARTVFGERVGRMFARSARLDRFEHALSERGTWLVLLLRLSPLAPIGPVSYGLGVMRIPLKSYWLAMPAVVPSVLLYVYAGHIARGLMNGRGAREAWEWGVLALGFAATVAVTVWIGRAAQRALGAPRAA